MELQASLGGRDPRGRLRSVARACAAGATLLGIFGLAAWGLGVGSTTALIPGLPPMTPNTALQIVLAGTSLVVRTSHRATRWTGGVAIVFAALVSVLAGATLAAYAFGIPGIPFRLLSAPQTATSLLFLSFALILFDRQSSKGHRPAEGLALCASSIAILAVLGHLFDLGLLYKLPQVRHHIGVSPSTAAALIALSLGVLLARPDQGFMATVTSSEVGGWVVRRLLLG